MIDNCIGFMFTSSNDAVQHVHILAAFADVMTEWSTEFASVSCISKPYDAVEEAPDKHFLSQVCYTLIRPLH